MWRRLVVGVLWAVPAYLAGAFGGGYLIYLTSANHHDRSVEASMTGAFVLGPLAAIIAVLLGARCRRRGLLLPGPVQRTSETAH